ncbi:MAG: hypothetical protein P4L27_14945 [Ignavibacteriaceae bacterium]|nr:hypothetical protein [Ignavibacteriaceae bacterium]
MNLSKYLVLLLFLPMRLFAQTTSNGKYDFIEPVGDKYMFSHFQKPGEPDVITLQRALDYIYFRNIVMTRYKNGYGLTGDTTLTTPSELFIDKRITLTDSIHVWSNETISSDFAGNNSNCNVITVDLNDSTKNAVTLWNGWGGSYNSSVFKNCYFNFISPAYSMFYLFRPMGTTVDNCFIEGGFKLKNGIIFSQSCFFTLQKIQIQDVTGYGVWIPVYTNYPPPYDWIKDQQGLPNFGGTTTTLLNEVNITRSKIGLKIDCGAVGELYYTNSCIQCTDSSALVCDGGTHLSIDHFYTEQVPLVKYHVKGDRSAAFQDVVPVIKLGTSSGGNYYNLGRYNIANSKIGGNVFNNGVGIKVGWAVSLNVSYTYFDWLNHSLETDSNTVSVLWEGNHEDQAVNNKLTWIIASGSIASNYGIADSDRITIISSTYSGWKPSPVSGSRNSISPPFTKIPLSGSSGTPTSLSENEIHFTAASLNSSEDISLDRFSKDITLDSVYAVTKYQNSSVTWNLKYGWNRSDSSQVWTVDKTTSGKFTYASFTNAVISRNNLLRLTISRVVGIANEIFIKIYFH